MVNLIGYVDNKSFENTNLKSILKSLTANAIYPILIEKMLVKKYDPVARKHVEYKEGKIK